MLVKGLPYASCTIAYKGPWITVTSMVVLPFLACREPSWRIPFRGRFWRLAVSWRWGLTSSRQPRRWKLHFSSFHLLHFFIFSSFAFFHLFIFSSADPYFSSFHSGDHTFFHPTISSFHLFILVTTGFDLSFFHLFIQAIWWPRTSFFIFSSFHLFIQWPPDPCAEPRRSAHPNNVVTTVKWRQFDSKDKGNPLRAPPSWIETIR